MAERPTERTYAAELAKMIAIIGESIGFDAEVEKKTPSGYPDVIIYYKEEPIAVIEIKKPEVPLSDPDLNKQALRYAEWYRKKKRVKLYGIHNMRYIKLFRYASKSEKRGVTILDYIEETISGWVPVSDFPFKIMPWVSSINDYKQIRTHKEARQNLKKFLLYLKEIQATLGSLLFHMPSTITIIHGYRVCRLLLFQYTIPYKWIRGILTENVGYG